MSTTTSPEHPTSTPAAATGAPHAQPDLHGERGLAFTRLVLIELRKSVDTRAGRWLLVVMTGLVVAVCLAMAIWLPSEDQTYGAYLGLSSFPLFALLPIIGIMSATQEWSQRTGLTTFVLEPRRGRVVAAKLVASVLLGAAVLLAWAAGAAIATLVGGGDFTLDEISVAGIALAMALVVLQGVGFGLALLSTPLAIVAILVLPTAWTLLTSLFGAVERVAPWLDLNVGIEPLVSGAMTGDDWAQLATSSALWVALPIAVGTWRVLHREIA